MQYSSVIQNSVYKYENAHAHAHARARVHACACALARAHADAHATKCNSACSCSPVPFYFPFQWLVVPSNAQLRSPLGKASRQERGEHPRGHTPNLSHAGLKLGSATWVPECVAVVATAPPSEAQEHAERRACARGP